MNTTCLITPNTCFPQVLTAVTDIISTIVQWDWPNDWPGLIDTLVFRLNSENKFSVHGALLVLKKFHIREADTPTLDAVAIISSEMHRIFAGENVGSTFSWFVYGTIGRQI